MMRIVRDYLNTAKENEAVFRSILRDLKNNRKTRPMGMYVPESLQTEAPLEEIFRLYSEGRRYGIFSICDFGIERVGNETFAIISFQDVACLSGGGATLRYAVNNKEASYLKAEGVMMS
jgi:hypothetical protein